MATGKGGSVDIDAMAAEIRNSNLSDAEKLALAKRTAEELKAVYSGLSKALFIAEATRKPQD